MARVPRHGVGTRARASSLEHGVEQVRTGASPVFVDGSGRRSRHFRGATATALLVLALFLIFAVGIVVSYVNTPVHWQPDPTTRTTQVGP